MLFAVFKLIGGKLPLLWVSIGVNALSLVLETLGFNYVSILLGTPSLNVFNWAGFFALGMLARRYRWDRRLIQSRPAGWICVAVFAALYGLTVYGGFKEGGTTYYRMDAAIFELSALLALYFLSYQLAGRRQRLLCEIGSCTYCVYLYHLIIIPGLTSMINLPIVLTPAVPFIGLAIMMGLIEAGKWICKLLKIKWPMTLVGLKG
jgi:surface polysaccharide O-acyltransferase-like enzyme